MTLSLHFLELSPSVHFLSPAALQDYTATIYLRQRWTDQEAGGSKATRAHSGRTPSGVPGCQTLTSWSPRSPSSTKSLWGTDSSAFSQRHSPVCPQVTGRLWPQGRGQKEQGGEAKDALTSLQGNHLPLPVGLPS